MRNFLEPESPWNQPFDILEYFPGFRAYYKKLVTAEERVGDGRLEEELSPCPFLLGSLCGSIY